MTDRERTLKDILDSTTFLNRELYLYNRENRVVDSFLMDVVNKLMNDIVSALIKEGDEDG